MTTTDETPIPQALAMMLPHGKAAILASQVLARADEIADALDHSPGASELSILLREFHTELYKSATEMVQSPATAPLTGTSARSIVHTIAESILTMPEPTPADGGWRQAVHDQIWRTGSRYTQIWKKDATYWQRTGQTRD
jgi:hypothetical protein